MKRVASVWLPTTRLWFWFVLVFCHGWFHSSSAFVYAPVNRQRSTANRRGLGALHDSHLLARRNAKTTLPESPDDDSPRGFDSNGSNDTKRAIYFSSAMIVQSALLGPFLDAYHSAFGVLQYNRPLTLVLWGSNEYPALTTTWWVPLLFGLAGFIIGWLYVLLDRARLDKTDNRTAIWTQPSGFKILMGISLFTFQYWLSGILYSSGAVDRSSLLSLMSVLATAGFVVLDSTFAGFLTSTATAVGGPLIEAGILKCTTLGLFGLDQSGYHYNDLGETGFFPLWIAPIYFLGGPAVGNLARGTWNQLGIALDVESQSATKASQRPLAGCSVCNDTRCVPCPNCEGLGSYDAMGNRMVKCTSCRGRGFVICRSCFDYYDEDPNDIEAIRELMSRMPD
mmetsp:Transcript_15675/g.43240  ORF Transcript_15675/g.43240 Transcript_15675/m.43240 type:complete len:395 (-) Transcript_15675:342-1526(-)